MERHTKFAPRRDELFYYDEAQKAYKPVVDSHGMTAIQSVQKKWKDSFSSTTLNEEKWEVLQLGENQSIDASMVGNARINTGTTPNAETIILSKEHFTVPMRGLFGFQISQKIANQEFYLEFVSIDETTLQPNDLHRIAWKISGTDIVTTTSARVITQTGGMAISESANLSVAIAQTASALYELELFSDEAWYHTRTMDATTGRSYSAVRHNNVPDPNALYKMQIRVKNGAVAPASNTFLQLNFVNVIDYAELTAEITSGRGSASAGQGIATTVAGGALSSVSTITTAYVAPKSVRYTETVANLTLATPFTGVIRDAGSTPLYTTYRIRVFSDQPIRIDVYAGTSATLLSNRIQQTETIPANTMTILEVPIIGQYIGLRATNVGTATTTAMEILTSLVGFR